MTPEIIFILGLIGVVAAVLITERLRPDLAALLLLVVLGLTGLVGPDDLFLGFGRQVVITILSLSILTNGLERTGATRVLGRWLRRLSGEGEFRTVLVVMIAAALLSLVMNTIASAAVLLPAVIGVSRQTGLRVSRLLIPLAFGSLLGGMATLFTTANLLVSAALTERGLPPYGVLDFLPVGGLMAIAGIGYMAASGWRLLPDRSRELDGRRRVGSLSDAYAMKQAVHAVYVQGGSALANRSIADGGWGQRLGLNVLGISRGGAVRLAPAQTEKVIEGDVVLFTGFTDDEELAAHGLTRTDDPTWQGELASEIISLAEVTLAPRSSLAGKTLRDINFRERYDLSVLAIWREGSTLRDALAEIPLKFGDALLMQGKPQRIQLLRNDRDFLVLEEDTGAPVTGPRAWLAVGLTMTAIALAATNVLPIAQSTFAAAVLMVLSGCLTMDDAYAAIEWRSIFLIVGMLPLGLAMTTTGTAAYVGEVLVNLLGGWGPLAVAAGLFTVSTLLTQIISGQVTPVVLAPIAIAAAERVGADPRALAMAVALGCSTAFLTPISHSVNTLVMGPGGYKFGDYARAGLPLTVLMLAVLLAGLALFWNVR